MTKLTETCTVSLPIIGNFDIPTESQPIADWEASAIKPLTTDTFEGDAVFTATAAGFDVELDAELQRPGEDALKFSKTYPLAVTPAAAPFMHLLFSNKKVDVTLKLGLVTA